MFEERSAEVDAVITSDYSKKKSERKCTLRLIHTKKFGWVVHVGQGAVTGWEYFGVEGRENFAERFRNGWLACAGGGGEDELYIPGDQMLKALTELKLA
ncbi:hypothetical protein GCM10027578_21780 [Spirosoma luteolum]